MVLLVGTAFLTSLSSCKKELANELTNDTYEDAFWKTESDVNAAVAGAYGLLRNSLNTNSCFFIWGDTPAGTFASSAGSLTTAVLGGDFKVPYRDEGAHNWTNWYKVVDLSNLIIENVQRMPDNLFNSKQSKNYLLGEAYFLRGLAYFYMTRTWGDVPLQLKATTSANVSEVKYIPATNTMDIIKQVIADGKKASSLLSWEGAGNYQKRRASKGAALALLAHATAWKTPVGVWQNDNEQAVKYVDSILNRPDLFNLQPTDNIRKVFKNPGEPENIFVISAKDSENEGAAWTRNIWTANIAYVTLGSDVSSGSSNPHYFVDRLKIDELYEPDDTRIDDFYFVGKDVALLSKYSDVIFKGATAAGPTEPRAESNLIIFRLADMILLKAECLNAMNRDIEAKTELNKIRMRAGASQITKVGLPLAHEILIERRRELIGEGHNYFDMVRTGLFIQIPWTMDNSRKAQKGYYWPVDNDILNANRFLNQIPYWNGKL